MCASNWHIERESFIDYLNTAVFAHYMLAAIMKHYRLNVSNMSLVSKPRHGTNIKNTNTAFARY